MDQVSYRDAPPVIQALVLQAESLLLRVYQECAGKGQNDIVLDLKVMDFGTGHVRVSALDRIRFRNLIQRVDPLNPFVGKLSQSLEGDGFWVSVRTGEDHYIYTILLREHLN